LYVKLNKCSFFQTEVHYLGHVVSKKGIAVDPEKIGVIMEWVAPKSVDKVRSFMGLARYYRRFIKNFSQIAYLLHHCKGKLRSLNGQKSVTLALSSLRSC